ncbi:MAG: hypothetical protein PWP65_160 [Clostridia bacterium]|nr:hypothetical protein [Clostridia bacterium]
MLRPRPATPFLSAFTVFLAVILAAAIVLFPREVFQGALRGLKTWWEVVLPALLPFFIVSQIFMGLGIVHFLGVLLEPVMRPLFNVPGSGAFIMAMGYTSGAPISAMLTAELRQQGLLSRIEGERLLCFTNNASPLFMLGAVAVGMLDNPLLGPTIALAHYSANFLLGICFRFYGRRQEFAFTSNPPPGNIIYRAWQALLQAQQSDNRALGKLLGDAVSRSFQTLITIGGFIILFAVIIQLADAIGFLKVIVKLLGIILAPWGFDSETCRAIAAGFLEMTMGTKFASEALSPLPEKLAAISLILGWAGLSIHAQVAAVISNTDLRLFPFLVARLLHGLLASQLVYLFLGPAQPVMHFALRPFYPPPCGPWPALWMHYTGFSLGILLFLFLLAAVGMAAYGLARR